MILDQMNYEALLIPLNKFYDLHIGGPRRPVFFDIAATRPELLDLDRNFAVIRQELLGILPDKRSIPAIMSWTRCSTTSAIDPDRDWKVYPLNIMGVKPDASCSRRPQDDRGCWTGFPGYSRRSSRFWKGASRSRRTRSVPRLPTLSPRPGGA